MIEKILFFLPGGPPFIFVFLEWKMPADSTIGAASNQAAADLQAREDGLEAARSK